MRFSWPALLRSSAPGDADFPVAGWVRIVVFEGLSLTLVSVVLWSRVVPGTVRYPVLRSVVGKPETRMGVYGFQAPVEIVAGDELSVGSLLDLDADERAGSFELVSPEALPPQTDLCFHGLAFYHLHLDDLYLQLSRLPDAERARASVPPNVRPERDNRHGVYGVVTPARRLFVTANDHAIVKTSDVGLQAYVGVGQHLEVVDAVGGITLLDMFNKPMCELRGRFQDLTVAAGEDGWTLSGKGQSFWLADDAPVDPADLRGSTLLDEKPPPVELRTLPLPRVVEL
jgi:hypothetical protein